VRRRSTHEVCLTPSLGGYVPLTDSLSWPRTSLRPPVSLCGFGFFLFFWFGSPEHPIVKCSGLRPPLLSRMGWVTGAVLPQDRAVTHARASELLPPSWRKKIGRSLPKSYAALLFRWLGRFRQADSPPLRFALVLLVEFHVRL